jgi:hypothetical protein
MIIKTTPDATGQILHLRVAVTGREDEAGRIYLNMRGPDMSGDGTRAELYAYVTPDDVDRMVAALIEVRAHQRT